MRIESDIKLGFKDVLIRPKRSTMSSRFHVDLERTYSFINSGTSWTGIPIIAANMDTVGTFSVLNLLSKHKMLTAIHKHYSIEKWKEQKFDLRPEIFEHLVLSSGITERDSEFVESIMKIYPGIRFLCIDVANGYSIKFIDFVKKMRERYPHVILIAGNVVTGEIVEELIISGADIVKVGIGPGSVCTTRVKTGVGYPQLSAIIECADAAHGLKGQIIGDGGCTTPGDVAKAFGGGSDFVMLGGMLAGHMESEGEISESNGKKYVSFYGMSSSDAMIKYSGKVAEYRAPEGKRVKIPLKEDLNETVGEILGGIRSTCTYVGAVCLKELTKRTTFVRVNEQENQVFNQFNSQD